MQLPEGKTTYKCKEGDHTDCYGIVQGNEGAGSWYVCVCECHKWTTVEKGQ